MFLLSLADAAPWVFGGIGLAALLGIGLVILLLTIFWVWMLVDCITNEALDGTERLIWALVIFFSHFLGSTLYFLLVRNKRGASPHSLP